MLPGQYQSERYEAVTARVNVQDELEIWTPSDRRALLFRFWNTLMDAYGRPPASSTDEFEQVAGFPRLAPYEKKLDGRDLEAQ